MNRTILLMLMFLLAMPFGLACVISDNVQSGRYLDSSVGDLWINCSGSAADSCYYQSNNYVNVSITDCSNFTFDGVAGMNSVEVCGSNVTSWNCSSHTLWLRNTDGSLWDYMNIWILLFLFFACLLVSGWTGIGAFGMLGGLVGCLMGYEVIAVSWLAGVVLMIMLPLACLIMVIKGR